MRGDLGLQLVEGGGRHGAVHGSPPDLEKRREGKS